jgi:hypothetical protein
MNLSSQLLVVIVRVILLVTALERSLCLSFQPLSRTSTSTTTTPSSQSTTTAKQRTIQRSSLVDKASKKLFEFGTNTNSKSTSYPHGILMVDGNNVRGIAKFQWSPVELSCRIAQLCHTYNISHHVIVWDHGLTRFAAMNAVNSVTLFSGLVHRADDILTQEARHIVELFQRRQPVDDGSDHDTSFGWGPEQLCFVTNDGELQSRLRRVHERGEKETNGRTTIKRKRNIASASVKERPTTSIRTGPLILDSTGFVELLSSMDTTTDSWSEDQNPSYYYSSRTNSVLGIAMDQAQESLKKFAQLQKTKYNPRREKTWERCILAEWLQRAYCQGEPLLQTTIAALNNHPTPQQAFRELEVRRSRTGLDVPLSFGTQYLQDLESRGFVTPSSDVSSATLPLSLQNETTTTTIPLYKTPIQSENDTWSSIPGPLRLDKREKRLLQKYNSALRKGLVQ